MTAIAKIGATFASALARNAERRSRTEESHERSACIMALSWSDMPSSLAHLYKETPGAQTFKSITKQN